MAGLSELKTGGKNNLNKSVYPAEGSHLPGGTFYTGSYPYNQGVSSAITPHHDDIHAS